MKPPGTENGIIRYSYLIRAVAILLVILDHCVYRLTSEVVDWKVYAYVFGCNSLLFFMIAGVHNLPVTGVRAFYIKRILKIGIPTAIFVLLYAYLDRYVYGSVKPGWFLQNHLLDVPFDYPQPWLWFMYVLGGLYLIAPFMSQVILNGKKKLIEFYLVMWFATGFLPYVSMIVERAPMPEEIFHPFIGYLGYMLAGWYLHNYPFQTWSGKKQAFFVAVVVVAIVFPLIISHTKYDAAATGKGIYCNNLSALIMALSLLVFVILQNVNSLGRVLDKVVEFVAKQAFAMYLVHFYIIEHVVKEHFGMTDNVLCGSLLAIAITIAVAYPLQMLFTLFYKNTQKLFFAKSTKNP